MVTRKINGGTNGLADRINWYTRAALVLAGFKPDDVKGFQRQAQASRLLPAGADQIDGVAGPKTRAALHLTLAAEAPATATTAAPVVEETVVAPKGADKTLMQRIAAGGAIAAPVAPFFLDFDQNGKLLMLGIGLVAVVVMLWRGELIAARVLQGSLCIRWGEKRMNWLLDLVPWWAWLLLAAVSVGTAWRLLGWQGALVAAAGLLAAPGYGKGRADASTTLSPVSIVATLRRPNTERR
ncbi:hypothetical protein N8D56_21175 [Devosia sp. A8/3-2]|nr:hypothetical protein N8D56_21175 [Devosia sp. A8/3-2]